MPKPPQAPPNSDIDGVDEDRKPIDHPKNAAPEVRKEDALRRRHSIGKPDIDSVRPKRRP